VRLARILPGAASTRLRQDVMGALDGLLGSEARMCRTCGVEGPFCPSNLSEVRPGPRQPLSSAPSSVARPSPHPV